MPRFPFFLAVALVASMQGIGSASAQTYPSRTVKFILPFGPASGTDIVARLVGDKLAARWGKPVVIENRPGGDGLISINAFTSANDDHTLLWVPVGLFAVHPFEREKLPYDADRDLLPIVGVTSLALSASAPESLNDTDTARVHRAGESQSRQVQRRGGQRQRRLPAGLLPEEHGPARWPRCPTATSCRVRPTSPRAASSY